MLFKTYGTIKHCSGKPIFNHKISSVTDHVKINLRGQKIFSIPPRGHARILNTGSYEVKTTHATIHNNRVAHWAVSIVNSNFEVLKKCDYN